MGGLGSGFSESGVVNDWTGLDNGESEIVRFDGVASYTKS